MKLLIYNWRSFLQMDLYYVLDRMGISYDVFDYDFSKEGRDKNYDEHFVKVFSENYSCTDYDAIFSIAYWPALSDAAMASGMKYISWSYDCPLDATNPTRTLNNPCNYVFLFDSNQVDSYISEGINTVYHMPLGINVDRYETYSILDSRCNPYRTDISFVGDLYLSSTKGLKQIISTETANLLDDIIEKQKHNSKYELHELISTSFTDKINNEIEALNPLLSGNITQSHLEYTIAREITSYNRLMLLMLLGKIGNTTLYTSSNVDTLPNIDVHPRISYVDEMPWCFAASKVNLNSTLITITSALPLRALDIMACGGFLLSNNQQEFKSMGYVDGQNVALFSSFEEAVEKCRFYLSHEDLRSQIAQKGRATTFQNHRLDSRLKEILTISFK